MCPLVACYCYWWADSMNLLWANVLVIILCLYKTRGLYRNTKVVVKQNMASQSRNKSCTSCKSCNSQMIPIQTLSANYETVETQLYVCNKCTTKKDA